MYGYMALSLERVLTFSTKFVCRRPRLVVCVGVFWAAVGLWLTATRLGYVSNTMDLIREDAHFRKIYMSYVTDFDKVPPIVVVARGERAANRKALEWLAAQLKDNSLFERVDWRLDYSKLKFKSVMLADPEELRRASEELSTLARGLAGAPLDWQSVLSLARQSLARGQSEDLDLWLQQKPRLEELQKQLAEFATVAQKAEWSELKQTQQLGLGRGLQAWEEREHIEFDDGRMALMLIRPAPGNQNEISPFHQAIAEVRAKLSQAKELFPEVNFGLTGEPVLDADQVETSIVSVAWASVIALVLIVVLFLVSYREATRPLLAVATLLIGTFWTFGLATVTVGHLNIISNAFVAMVLGLGIDFGIQIIGRYEEALSRGKTALDALSESVAYTGSAIFVGAITTTAAFFTMCFNDFIGLAELGIIAGSGVALCLVANLTVLPALIWLADRKRENLAGTALATHWRGGLLLKEPFRNRPAVALALAALVTVLLCVVAWLKTGETFDYNLLNLQNPQLESVRVEKDLIAHGQQSINYAVVVVDSLQEAAEIAKKLRALPTVADVASAADLLTANDVEKMLLAGQVTSWAGAINTQARGMMNVQELIQTLEHLVLLLQEARNKALPFAGVSDDAREASELLGALTDAARNAVDALRPLTQEQAVELLKAWDAARFAPMRAAIEWLRRQQPIPVTVMDIPALVRQRFLGMDGRFAIEVYPRENVWERKAAERFIREVRSVAPDVTGTPVLNLEYLRLLREAFVRAGVLALGVIVVVMLVHFHNLRLTFLAIVPLGLAIVWTVGLMPLLGLKFNPANIITLPLTVGVGVAYGIYVVDRLRENANVSLFDTSTAKSVWLSALTTVIGFGSLIQSSYRGISTLGLLMTLSVGMCLLTSLYVLPALLRIGARKEANGKTQKD